MTCAFPFLCRSGLSFRQLALSKANTSNVNVCSEPGMSLNEFASRFNLVAHECGEYLVGRDSILHCHPEHRSCLRVHRRLPQLLRIHLSKALVPLNRVVGLPQRIQEFIKLAVAVYVMLFLALPDHIKRRLGNVHVPFSMSGVINLKKNARRRVRM